MLLDTLSVQSGGKMPSGMALLMTEFGYESNPPDTRNGIPLMRQAEFNALAEFLAYTDPRVTATTQFLLRDAAPLKQYPKGSRLYWFTYQSGLVNNAGRAKPAAFAYTFPLVVYNPGVPGLTNFWGQLRFRPNGVTRPRGRLLATDAQQQALRAGRVGAAGAAGPDELPRLLQRHVPDAGPGRRVLRGLPRPGEGQDHPPLADGRSRSAGSAGERLRALRRALAPAALDLRLTKRLGERL